MKNYLHPNITTNIIDESAVTVAAEGSTKLFCAFPAEKGPDNVITTVNSTAELIVLYGQPNIKKYGQAQYNMINWLNAGGSVYALRVAPEDAGYAHTIFNISTKIVPLASVQVDGQARQVDVVNVRPTIITTPSNTSKASIKAELSAVHADSIDGYKNHMLFAVLPKGRGSAYNNLGFRLSLTSAYDDTYEFRCYNLEVTRTTRTGDLQIIEGPFLVSLEPNAKATSNESLFIKHVVNKYSKHIEIIFNEAAYEELGRIMNPYVHPQTLDMVSGITRKVAGALESYNDPKFNAVLPTHFYTEYVNVTDSVEALIMDVDNTARSKAEAQAKAALQAGKDVYNAVLNNKFSAYIDAVIKNSAGSTLDNDNATATYNVAYKGYTEAQAAYTRDKAAFSSGRSDETLNTLDTSITKFFKAVESYNDANVVVKDVAMIIKPEDPEVVNHNTLISTIDGKLKAYNIVVINASQKDLDVLRVTSALDLVDTYKEKLSVVNAGIDELQAIAKWAKTYQSDVVNDEFTNLDTQIKSLMSKYEIATNRNLPETDYDAKAGEVLTQFKVVVGLATKAIRIAAVSGKVALIEDIHTAVTDKASKAPLLAQTVNGVVTTASDESEKAKLLAKIDTIIDKLSGVARKAMSKAYVNKLNDINDYVKFSGGKDGVWSDDLLAKAYRAELTPELTDKKLYPIDMIIDANYSLGVKNAIITLTKELRDDVFCILDTNLTAGPKDAIDFRKDRLQVSDFRVAIYTQDELIYDQYTGSDVKVTSPYFLAAKYPFNEANYGLHAAIAGSNRGLVDGFKELSWNPTTAWKEQLYLNQINYIEQDNRRTKFMSQLTSQTKNSSLSNINNVLVLLRIKRAVELMAEDYQFEYNDETTLNSFQYNLNTYLATWEANRACSEIKGTVYATDYDKQNKMARVKIEIVFNNVIERIAIDLVVGK